MLLHLDTKAKFRAKFFTLSSHLQGFAETDTWLSIAIKIIKAAMKGRIIGSASDKMSIILFGTVSNRDESHILK